MDYSDITPLLAGELTPRRKSYQASSNGENRENRENSGDVAQPERIQLKRHITMIQAVFIIIGNVIGSGIFVSPKGVTENMNSVGGSLIIWVVTGFINLGQALCYAELGGMIPVAGGDYAYVFYILGPVPAFLCAWVHILLASASGCGVIARTAALYLIEPLGLDCRMDIITILAIIIIITLATINVLSAVWGKRVHLIFTVAKTFALLAVIISGMVLLGQGNTSHFTASFEGTTTDPGKIGLALLDGYFAYKAWELINALPEEMVNPKRDLKPAVVIGMLSVTVIYTFTNVAYFSALSPDELVSSDTVALTYSEQALGGFHLVMPVFVALSCMGAVNGDFMANSRYLFAGGRFKQLPQVFAFIHIKFLTPFIAIATLCVLALVYCVFTNLQILQEYSSLAVQLKTVFALVALFYFRWKHPNVHRPFKVNFVVAVLTFLVTVTIVGLSFYKSPAITGIGVGIMAIGLPVYALGIACAKSAAVIRTMDKITRSMQKIFLIVPETKTEIHLEFHCNQTECVCGNCDTFKGNAQS